MTRARLFGLPVVISLMAGLAASAQTAYTVKTVNVRAGPSRDYPLVAQVPPGMAVAVSGCVNDWTWCDVGFGDDHGWVYAGNLDFPYQGRRVIILNSGAFIGLPIVTFSIGPYWDRYYSHRPWYGRRSYWASRPAPPHRPPLRRPAVVRPGRSGPPAARSPQREAQRPRHEVQARPVPHREAARPKQPRPTTKRERPKSTPHHDKDRHDRH
jgi:uncharacterized protein YraI